MDISKKVNGGFDSNSKDIAGMVLTEIKKAVVGKDDVISKVMMAILSDGHVLIEDVPGVGKTTLALAFSKALGLDYKRMQFTSDSMPSDIIGFSVFDKGANSFKYQKGVVMTNLFLADEINRTSSKTQSALLEVMEERQISLDGKTHLLPDPFIVLATQNPVGSAGTQMLPPSQLDRFMIKINMGYPAFEDQVNILKDRHSSNPLQLVLRVTNSEELIALRERAREVYIDDSIYEYITRLIEATRNNLLIELGVSPRGALAVCQMAKAHAFLSSRSFVTPFDVARVFSDVTAHRIILSRKAKISALSSHEVISDIIKAVDPPPLEGAEGPKASKGEMK